MCGIAGEMAPDRTGLPDLDAVQSMTQAMRSRGPDGGVLEMWLQQHATT